MILHFESHNMEDTLALGNALGAALQGGETIELISDLGGGKTALAKGIAAGMGSADTVQSPTFTVSRVYRGKNKRELHHFDFYRLSDPGVMAGELADVLGDDKVVVLVEWGGIVEAILPQDTLRIAITVTGETSRLFKLAIPDAHTNIVEAASKLPGTRQA